ncbi:MAG: sigma-70 family RNA polymerase sigma factor [Planctomycetota bacterium]
MTALLPSPGAPAAATFPELSDHDLHPIAETARRLLGCDHLAQDAVQEALLTMSQQPSLPERPLAWLTTAVMHRCLHLRRTLRRRRYHEHVASERCDQHADCDNPLHVAMAHELGDLLSAARDTLPPEQRQALDLYECDGKDYREIASLLGIPIGTVRSRLSRARQALDAAVQQWQA